MVAKRALNVASAILALLIMAFLVWEASDAAFSASTDGESGTVAAAEITLSDDDGLSSIPFEPILFPGQDSIVACVAVTYGDNSNQVFAGTPASPVTAGEVRFYVSALTVTDNGAVAGTPIDQVMEVRVDAAGTTACDTAVPVTGDDFDGALSTLGTDYATGAGDWVPSAAGETQYYEVQFSFPAGANDDLQGDEIAFELTWEVQTP